MACIKASSSSPSSMPTRGWKYDVFLSFRGKDTRNSFVDHLYTRLVDTGISLFKDEEGLHKGEQISLELLKAIEESRLAVVVFSRNYGDSSWCLDELVKIMECRDQLEQKLLPVFYHVAPSDVRKQNGKFATAFQEHEQKFKGEMEKVNKWRKALTRAANLDGWHISENSRGEASIINEIVQKISDDIPPPHAWENDLIGLESHIDALNSLLKLEATEVVRIVGICGMGGIGKTTIAQALFRRISKKFEGCSFVKNVRENGASEEDICALQENILKDVLRAHFNVKDRNDGASQIGSRLKKKKVLLVLDDVDKQEQLEYLAKTHEWFGGGSRIIITTRDNRLLSYADEKYKPPLLLTDQAVELFSRHAFRKNQPPEMYEKLSHRAVCYTGRLPLALKVLGSFFYEREVDEWEDALNRLVEAPDDTIFNTLKLSYDALTEHEKRIFLDIAFFFKGKVVEDVIIIHDCCGFYPRVGINVLIEKSLISISKKFSKKRLEMHDLIQDMGLKIVRESFPNSRLMQFDDMRNYFVNRKLKSIEAIVALEELDVYELYDEKQGFNADVFYRMKNLRLLQVQEKFTSCEPTVLPNNLQWFCWKYYPFNSLPVSQMSNLFGLKMEGSEIQHLWNGKKIMQNLKFVHLSGSRFLTTFPDVSGAPKIEKLVLSGCRELMEVHESLGFLKRLVYLDMSGCSILKHLPSMIEMDSLETLYLSGCRSLKRFPEVSPCMVKLSYIGLRGCDKIEELPSSIKYLSSLSILDLTNCKSLKTIPKTICELKCLKSLFLHDCKELQKLPEEFGSIESLEELRLGSQRLYVPFEGLPESIKLHALTNLCSLRKLDFNQRQIGDEDFPQNLHGFSSLEELLLSRNLKLIQLPAGISHLSRLKRLVVEKCSNLKSLHGLPSGLQVLDARDCRSLEKIEDLLKKHDRLNTIWLAGCPRLVEDEESKRYLDEMLQQSFLKKCAAVDRSLNITIPGSKIPSWVTKQPDYCGGGGEIVASMKLPLNWETEILGFVVCEVFGKHNGIPPCIIFISEIDVMDNTEMWGWSELQAMGEENDYVFIGYVPFSLFQQPIEEEDDELHHKDWSYIIQGDFFVCGRGVDVVYKKDVESYQQMKPSISSYWNWKPSKGRWYISGGFRKYTSVYFESVGQNG